MSWNKLLPHVVSFVLIIFTTYAVCQSVAPQQKNTVQKIDFILVEKSKRTMTVFYKDVVLKTYKIALGENPVGHKQKQGDSRTPEGHYRIQAKNPNSQFHKSLKISYPNAYDEAQAKKNNVSPGGDIMIHGLGKSFRYLGALHRLHDWTLGCIAVTDSEIDEIFAATPVGTPIEIRA